MVRKHLGKSRNCSKRVTSPFQTKFARNFYCKHVQTGDCLVRLKCQNLFRRAQTTTLTQTTTTMSQTTTTMTQMMSTLEQTTTAMRQTTTMTQTMTTLKQTMTTIVTDDHSFKHGCFPI